MTQYNLRINYTNNKEFNINRKLYEQLLLEIKTNDIDYVSNVYNKHKTILLKKGTPFVIKILELSCNKEITKDQLQNIITLMKKIGFRSNNKINIQFLNNTHIIYNYKFQSGYPTIQTRKNKKLKLKLKHKLKLKQEHELKHELKYEPKYEHETNPNYDSDYDSKYITSSRCKYINPHKFIYYFITYFCQVCTTMFISWFIIYSFMTLLYNM